MLVVDVGLLEQLDHPGQAVHGGPQLTAHGGEEAALGLIGGFGHRSRRLQLVGPGIVPRRHDLGRGGPGLDAVCLCQQPREPVR